MKQSPAASAGKILAGGGFLSKLRANNEAGRAWAVRGKVFARVMVAARDARLSGAEYAVLVTVALHLQHLGRSKGMMTPESLADDCMVTPRTIRNALRTLAACEFLHARQRADGNLELRLDSRFGPKAPVPGNKSVDKSPRRSAARKKISKVAPRLVSPIPLSVVERSYSPKQLNDSARQLRSVTYSGPTLAREFPGDSSKPRTANGNGSRHRQPRARGKSPPG